MLKPEVIAWALACEGSLALSRSFSRRQTKHIGKQITSPIKPIVSLSNTDKDLVEQFAQLIGMGSVTRKKLPNPLWKEAWGVGKSSRALVE